MLPIGAQLDELAPPRLPWIREESLSLLDVLTTLECAARDPQVDGVLVRFKASPSGWLRLSNRWWIPTPMS